MTNGKPTPVIFFGFVLTTTLALSLSVSSWFALAGTREQISRTHSTAPRRSVAAGPVQIDNALEGSNIIAVERTILRENPAQPFRTKIQTHKRGEEAPSWVVVFGKEFWRGSNAATNPKFSAAAHKQASGSSLSFPTSIDVREVMERVSHAFITNATQSCATVNARNYCASIDGESVQLASPSSQINPLPTVKIRTSRVWQGERFYYAGDRSARETSIVGNTVQRLLETFSGLVEHYEATSEGISITWILQAPIGRNASLSIEAELGD